MTNKEIEESFFVIKKNRQIIAFDLFGKKHKRWLKNFKFRPGVYGVLKKGDSILLQRHPLLSQFGLPGGGIDIDETIEQALIREFKEETGLEIRVGKILGVGEDFFTHNDEDAHGLFLYFEVKKTGGKLLDKGNGEDTAEVKFMRLTNLNKENTLRAHSPFLKTLLN